MKAKLTDTGIRCYQPHAAQYSIGDAACPGLCLRITPKGIKTFAFAYRNKGTGKVMWLTIGRYPDVPLAQAREIANDARKTAALGGTPVTPKVQRAEAVRKTKTYAELVELYFADKLATLRSGHNAHRTLQRIGRVYSWNERPAASITDDDAAAMLADIAKRGRKAMANQTTQLKMFDFNVAPFPLKIFGDEPAMTMMGLVLAA